MTKISIIGSDSFIATRLIGLISPNKEMQLFSRQSSGKQNEQIKDPFELEMSEFVECNTLINFAAIVHQPQLKDNNLYHKVNTELPIHLAKEAKKAGVRHFIQMSTIAVYGEKEFINEESKEKPVNIYGQSKLEADNQLLKLHDNDFKVSIIRPPMVYGGGKAPGNLQSLIKFALKGVPLPFNGVDNKRDFIHVQNLVQALHSVIDNKVYGVVIPTDKKPVSTCEIINYIQKYSDETVRNIKIPKLFHEIIRKLKPDIYSKVFGDLQVECNLPELIYKPEFGMDGGIKEMVDALKKVK